MSSSRSIARRLVDALSKQAETSGKSIDVLMEINVAGEEQKAGCPLDDAAALLDLCFRNRACGHLD